MGKKQTAFQVNDLDNVATALEDLEPGEVSILGDAPCVCTEIREKVQKGHKFALRDIHTGEDIIKYGVRIGRATCCIQAGEWVHLHNIHSLYDERSDHLDVKTGAPLDTRYE